MFRVPCQGILNFALKWANLMPRSAPRIRKWYYGEIMNVVHQSIPTTTNGHTHAHMHNQGMAG